LTKQHFERGIFVISLDFELHWGVSETKTVEDYRQNLDNTREAIRKMLELFQQYEVHVTWATVGFLFCKTKEELLSYVNNISQPQYVNKNLSNYRLLPEIGNDYIQDPYHYGNDMLSLIQTYPHQEIGTHTFSHYYCLEQGQSLKNFSDDMDAAISIASISNIKLNSIVFPRNQYSKDYLEICQQKNINVYRGNSTSWLYKPLAAKDQHILRRAGRLLDSYLNLSGDNTHNVEIESNTKQYNVPASRFLRPYNSKIHFLEGLRLRRIKKEMDCAAKQKKIYHLWWHPHNFGKNVDENIDFLKKILEHYFFLKNKFSFTSMNMGELPLIFENRKF
jgi:hypothetical protein